MRFAMMMAEIIPQRLKPQSVKPETAGITACSTLIGTKQFGLARSMTTGVR